MSNTPVGCEHIPLRSDGEDMSGAPAGCETFGHPRPGLRTVRRRELRVHLARIRDKRPYRNAPRSADTPSSTAATPPDPAAVAEAQRRFAICQACEHARDKAFACELFKGCCFGRFRSNPTNHCPTGRWSS